MAAHNAAVVQLQPFVTTATEHESVVGLIEYAPGDVFPDAVAATDVEFRV